MWWESTTRSSTYRVCENRCLVGSRSLRIVGGRISARRSPGRDLIRERVPQRKLGWQRIPTVAPNCLMAEEGEKYGLDIELVEFNRYSDMRVALENG